MRNKRWTQWKSFLGHNRAWVGLGIATLAIGVYGVKSYIGINLFDHFSVGSVFPLSYLTTEHLIEDPERGIVCRDDFEKKWASAWMLPETTTHEHVEKTFVKEGPNGSRCLRITNPGTADWECQYRDDIEVHPGEAYDLECEAMTRGEDATAYLSLIVSDEDRHLANCEFDRAQIENSDNTWVAARKHFVIGEHIYYIRPRLSGSGKGEYLFDNVVLRKL